MKTFIFFIASSAILLLASCQQNAKGVKPEWVDYYTCTMHPSVKLQHPDDKCPICGMNLVPVKKKPAAADAATPATNSPPREAEDQKLSEFAISPARLQQIGVSFGQVEKRPLSLALRAVGTVAYDKKRHWDYVARVDGYVKELFVFSRGELVEAGAPLITIYSPDLLTTENEFIQVVKMREDPKIKANPAVLASTEELFESAKERLRLWNISGDQITNLINKRIPEETLTLHSPFKGVVQDIGVDQGRKVMNGDHLVDIADLSQVWVWAQFYQEDLPLLKPGLPVTITLSSDPSRDMKGAVSVIDPFIQNPTRTARVRIDVKNNDLILRPDMYVDVQLTVDAGAGLAVPVSAVLPTGSRYIVFLDRGKGRLEPRFIDVGRKFGDYYAVQSGLQAGERVVTSANFLIDAEAKIQGALKYW